MAPMRWLPLSSDHGRQPAHHRMLQSQYIIAPNRDDRKEAKLDAKSNAPQRSRAI